MILGVPFYICLCATTFLENQGTILDTEKTDKADHQLMFLLTQKQCQQDHECGSSLKRMVQHAGTAVFIESEAKPFSVY